MAVDISGGVGGAGDVEAISKRSASRCAVPILFPTTQKVIEMGSTEFVMPMYQKLQNFNDRIKHQTYLA
jgi:hypothetical protein